MHDAETLPLLGELSFFFFPPDFFLNEVPKKLLDRLGEMWGRDVADIFSG